MAAKSTGRKSGGRPGSSQSRHPFVCGAHFVGPGRVMLQSEDTLSSSELSRPTATARANVEAPAELPATSGVMPPFSLRWRTMLAVPIAALVTLGIHLLISKNASPVETRSYALLSGQIIAVSFALIAAQRFWIGL